MKIAFHIFRINFYRFYGPIIQEALNQNMDVECWHDYSQPKDGFKGNLFPYIENAPQFALKQPRLIKFNGETELKDKIEKGEADLFISIFTPFTLFQGKEINKKVKWICTQAGVDFFITNHWQGLKTCDAIAVYSKNWLDFSLRYHKKIHHPCQNLENVDLEAEYQLIEPKIFSVGWPQADQIKGVTREQVKEKWGIDKTKSVVVLLPLDVDTFGEDEETRYSREIYYQESRVAQFKSWIKSPRLKYFKRILKGYHDAATIKTIKEFCQKNNALLVVKARQRNTKSKHQIPEYLEMAADKIIYDESFYPATIFEILSIADLCIHFYSLGVTEASMLRVPGITINPYPRFFKVYQELDHFSGTYYEFCDFDIFSAPFIKKMDAGDLIDNFSNTKLKDYKWEDATYSQYVQKFFEHDDLNSSDRFLQLCGKHGVKNDK